MSDTTVQVPDLIAACWTSAGDAAPLRGSELSPCDVRERIEAAGAVGWKGFGLLRADLVHVRDTIGYRTLRQLFDDNGIEHVELEYLGDWWTTGARREAADRYRDDLFDAVEPLGVRHIKVGAGMADEPVETGALCEGWAGLAERAGQHGVLLALESSPFSHLPTVESATDLVADVGHPCGGLMLDIWHTIRGGTDYVQMARYVPPEFVVAVELDDGAGEAFGTLFEDTINNRRYCGEGDFEVPAFIGAVQSLGFEGPWGVEIISETHRRTGLREGLARAYDTTAHCFEVAR